jgi:hypothetical protein
MINLMLFEEFFYKKTAVVRDAANKEWYFEYDGDSVYVADGPGAMGVPVGDPSRYFADSFYKDLSSWMGDQGELDGNAYTTPIFRG